MASNELLQGLIEATVAGSAAAALVLALRRPMRAAFGAQVAYALWLLPALAMLATLLPAATIAVERLPATPALVLSADIAVTAAAVQPGLDIAALLLVLWLCGALLAAGWLWRAQAAFRRGLGQLLPHGDALRAQAASAGLPATLGLWRPRIVLPSDFEERFDPAQRALVLAHERRHVARLDPWANAATALLRCLCWFNPLFHLAAARMRHDQELACDADVLAAHPQQRRRYGDALLNVQLALQTAPLGCHFGFGHPLKERIMLLNRERPALRMRRAGMALLALAAGATAWSVWAAQPPRTQVLPAAGDFIAKIEYSRDAGTPARSVLSKRFGESFTLPDGAGGNDIAITARVQPVRMQGKLAYDIAMRIEQDGKQIASPRMVVQPASLRQGQDVAGRFRGMDLRMQVAARDPQAALKGARTLPPPPPPVPPAPPRMAAPPPPAAPAPPPPPRPVIAALQSGSVDQASRALHPPRYPAEALKEGSTGVTVLVVDIDAYGGVTGTRVERSSGDARLDLAAQEAAAKWRFTPAMKKGRAVAGKVRVPVEFALDKPTQQAG
ncbi:TonB family protein [Thermomonas sp.]|jgi:TonB family protein|uniref:TonB family protein n=1 Tax=Thermomonas sp. TaxID=1971895 RepID=UPI00257ADB03|nr:TonB family protein [Thermomonas sp.]